MTYYGKHYTTFFYNTRQQSWFYFDDARVKEVCAKLAFVVFFLPIFVQLEAVDASVFKCVYTTLVSIDHIWDFISRGKFHTKGTI